MTTEDELRRFARRLLEGEIFALALCVEIAGWTAEARLKLEQIAKAAVYTDRMPIRR